MTDMSVEEKIRRYWIGKSPRVKKATMEWIESRGKITQDEVAKKHGTNPAAIHRHLKNLKKLGVQVTDKRREKTMCLVCGESTYAKFPKYRIQLLEKGENPKLYGYIHKDCFARELAVLIHSR